MQEAKLPAPCEKDEAGVLFECKNKQTKKVKHMSGFKSPVSESSQKTETSADGTNKQANTF